MSKDNLSTWALTTLEDISRISMGQSPTSDTYNSKNEGLPFFQGKAEFADLYPVAVKWCSKPKVTAERDDILLSVRAPVGALNIADMNCCIGRGLAAIKYPQCYKFVYYYLLTKQNYLKSQGSGSTFEAISGKDVRTLTVALPPLSEQRAIVAKLETLLSELDNAVASLKQAKEQIKTYRQSVLKAAFTGKLTEVWRKENKALTTYNFDRTNVGMREYKSEYPSSWKIYSFKDVCSIDSNLVNPSDYLNYPHIAPDNIEKESGLLLSYKTIKEDKVFSPKHKFHKGQIVYSKIRPYLSKVVLVGFDGLCSADMYPLTSKINSKFLLYYMLSSTFVGFASTAGTRSVLPKINQRELSIIPVPVSSVEEQQEIVIEIETRFSVADKLNQTIDESLSKAEALKQSLLKQTFEGKLLTEQELGLTRQAPDWEPAEKLLERIKLAKLR